MAQTNIQIQSQQQLQTLSPQQILVVKLLELPTVELEDRIHSEVLENPALEEGPVSENSDEMEGEISSDEDSGGGESAEDLMLGDYSNDDEIPDYKVRSDVERTSSRAEDIPFSDAVSFYDILKEQLGERDLSSHMRDLVEYLIGSIDNDGLLRKDLSNIEDELLFNYNVQTNQKELAQALRILQDFDPAGIGARNLQECLLLQIDRKEDSPVKKIEQRIIIKCYEDFTRKHWDKIIQKLNITQKDFEEAKDELIHLNPRPGSSLGEVTGRNFQQIVPDFIVETMDDGSIIMNLNDYHVPELHLNRIFTDMLEEHTKNKANQSKESREAMQFVKQKLDAAQGFIDAIKQRQHTLTVTMQAIIDLQRSFFEEGDETLLRPMILKDVAERTDLDISTISRVSNSKYVQTNYGIYSLKFFFSDGYTKEDGEELSVREIRMALKDCINKEDKSRPLTDDELAAKLKEKGFPIARRTVAKYREQLGIPVSRLRK